MPSARTQANRQIEMETSLGGDALMLLSMSGTEALGRLFHFELELMAEAPVDAGDILGQNVTIRLDRQENQERYFNGYVSRFTFVSVDEANRDHKRLYYYRATLVPWTWFLTRSADCRIFQNMTVPAIVEKIFRDRGLTDFKNRLSGNYASWEYCVQYRETDFNFVSRLMENEGIYYYFEHDNGKHVMVLCDASTAHKPAPDYKKLYFDHPDLKSEHDAFLWDWTLGQEITPNKYALTDYNPLKPNTSLLAGMKVAHPHDPGIYEVFDYPGGYATTDEARRYAGIRMEETEAQYVIARGATSARGVFTGCTFTLEDHPAYEPVEYLVTAMSYRLRNDDIGGGKGGVHTGPNFQAHVTCMPSSYEYRSERLTPKPIVQGPQTAVVVGPAGEEIHTDKYGRVKVRFHWDRDSKGDEKSSCFIRVSQNWAGKQWGVMFMPRIGQEVIVDFLEGDPDRPIITGRVYNADHMPPYDLPVHQTMSTIKSLSSKGGGGWNEIRFEDKKSHEQVFIHAQRQMDVRVGVNFYETNGGNREEVVGHAEKGDHNVLIHKDNNFHLMGDQYILIDKGQQVTITEDVLHYYAANVTWKIDQGYELQSDTLLFGVAKTLLLKADSIQQQGSTDVHIKGGKTYIEGAQAFHLSGGGPVNLGTDGDINLKGSNINLQAQSAINLKAPSVNIEGATCVNIKVGGNFVALSAGSVAINGTSVLLNSGGAAGPAGPAAKAEDAGDIAPPQDHEITTPVDALPADTGHPGTHGTGHWTPREHGKIKLGAVKIPPPLKKPPKPMIGGLIPPPVTSNEPCALQSLTVSCRHGRKPGQEGRLQIVADVGSQATFELGPLTIVHGSMGADSITSVAELKGKSSQPPRVEVTGGVAKSVTGTKLDFSAPGAAVPLKRIWNAHATPTIYTVTAYGCSGTSKAITVEAFPSVQNQFEFDITNYSKWVSGIVRRINDSIKNLVKTNLEIEPAKGKITGTLGWKEHDDWRAYWGGEITVGLVPLIKLTGKAAISVAEWIPLVIRNNLGDIDAYLELSGELKVEGRVSRSSPDAYRVSGGATGELWFELGLEAHAGSEEIVSFEVRGGGRTALEFKGSLFADTSSGLGLDYEINWKGLTAFVSCKTKSSGWLHWLVDDKEQKEELTLIKPRKIMDGKQILIGPDDDGGGGW